MRSIYRDGKKICIIKVEPSYIFSLVGICCEELELHATVTVAKYLLCEQNSALNLILDSYPARIDLISNFNSKFYA